MIISDYDKSMINKILSKQDIYHVSSLPWNVAARDVGKSQHESKTGLRHKWMYSNTGFFKSLDSYSNAFKRIDEYFEYGDSPFTLRQRMNIVNELLDCDFNSNLPVHISVSPAGNSRKLNRLNLNNDSINDWRFIIHPGQTRAQGSVFTRTNLKNVLIYMNKEHGVDVKMNSNKYITKIETLEQLIKFYRPNAVVDNDKLNLQFSVPTSIGRDYEGGFKKHVKNDIIILKCMSMYLENKKHIKNSVHSSPTYVFKSLKSINNFYKLFSNNRFNIYSNGADAHTKSQENGVNLFYNNKKTFQLNKHLGYKNNPTGYVSSYSIIFKNDGVAKALDLHGDGMFSKRELKLIKNYSKFLKENEELLNDVFSNSTTCNFEPNYIKITHEIDNWNDLVQRNNFSGICLYMHNDASKINDRDVHEFLFCINTSVAITRSEDDTVAIINCEHEYWKTGKNYKEWILPKSFYTP
jgi:hypothetical protein